MKINEFIKKNIIPITIVLIVIGAIAVSASVAYFTSSTERVLNVFSTGNIKISVIEENFNEIKASTVNPNQTINKDPLVKNIGPNPVYAFIQVEVPLREVTIVDDDKVTMKEDFIEMFSYTIGTNWILVDTKLQSDSTIYIYAYIGGILEPNQKSTPLFTEVTCVNYLEGSLDSLEILELVIKGLAVQSDNIKIEGTTISDELKYIYNTYVK